MAGEDIPQPLSILYPYVLKKTGNGHLSLNLHAAACALKIADIALFAQVYADNVWRFRIRHLEAVHSCLMPSPYSFLIKKKNRLCHYHVFLGVIDQPEGP